MDRLRYRPTITITINHNQLTDEQVEIQADHLLRLQSLQKDLIASRSNWTKKLAGVEVRPRLETILSDCWLILS